jgi:Tfp pilus assembly protein PilN
MPKKAGINLLNTKHSSFVERFLNWTLTIGRIVVICTELIALGAFLYRFSLDQQLIDLHSKIKQEQAIVVFLKDNEASYRNLQDRLQVASNFSETGTYRVNVFNDLIALAPPGIVFDDFNLTNDRIRINANVYSVSALSSFVDSIKKYKSIDKVLIDKIQNKASSGTLGISINATLKTKAYANQNR